ncbi:MAG: toxin-antitoxin system YwqK family antitoxin [Crocinitomicaceae bacterium]|nr:toxin-antitoxin system YwqK family antitoxin [Crocinitomicaceae bacterium]
MKYLLFTLFILLLNSTVLAQEKIRCGKVNYTLEGELVNSSSRTPIMNQKMGILPEIGARGELLKYFQSELFGGQVSGTLVIAEVEITGIKGSNVSLKVLEEKSQITVNGKKKNHFLSGNRVKLNIYDYQTPQLRKNYWETGEVKSEGMSVCGNKIGKWTYYHINGTKKSTYALNEDGEIEGAYEQFHPNGQLYIRGQYKDGKKEGEWKVYNPDGSDGGFLNYKRDEQYGKYLLKYPNGQTKEIGEYSFSGRIEGIQKGFYEDGKPQFEYDEDQRIRKEWYTNGNLKEEIKLDYSGKKKDGRCKEYYENGQLKSDIVYDDDEYEGDYILYYENGQIKKKGKYKWTDHKKDGEWLDYFENGKLAYKRNYYQGVMKGLNESYYENGQLKIKANYKNGEPDGEVISYFEDGKVKSQANFKEGKKEGIWKMFFEDGTLKTMKTFVQDKEEGPFEIYHEPGKLKEKGSKKGMFFQGPFESYYESGKLRSKGTFLEDGKRTGLWLFNDKEGNLEKKGNYENGLKTGKWIEVDENGKKKKVKY